MIFLRTGHFFGQTNKTIRLSGITLNDAEYTQEQIEWHYHENPYFTFVLQGNIVESNKKESYHCSAGSLLFHGWQEPHYNVKPEGFMRCLQIEFDKNWFADFDFDIYDLQGSFNIENPDIKFLLYKVFREQKEWHKKANPRAWERDKGGWEIPTIGQSAAIEQAAQMLDRFQRMYFRALRQLRDWRRYPPPMTINNPKQVNIATDGGQQINVSEDEVKK
jgi:hypothetical protein